MMGFPVETWILLFLAVVPGIGLAAWNAARGRLPR